MTKEIEQPKNLPPPYVLRSIFFKRAEISTRPDFDVTVANQALISFNRISSGSATTKVIEVEGPEGLQKIKTCSFATVCDFRYKLDDGVAVDPNQPDESVFVASITAEIIADYLLVVPEFPSEELIKQWSSKNAVLHIWPYWREFCQSSQQRLNLPSAIIPMLTV